MPINYLELLDGATFPATKVELVNHAIEQGASEEALEAIEALPHSEYRSIHSVSKELGLIEQLPGKTNMWGSA